MTRRAALTAALLCGLGAAVAGARALRPPAAPAVVAASPCRSPIALPAGIACRDRLPIGVRPGDRVDAQGRAVGRMTPEALAAFAVAIDPNRADAAELASLPGIGPVLGARIVAERARGGRFASARDLLRVSGIGDKTLARIAPRIAIEP
jgi:competence ComEA-like helix-hairpin-helix protein